MAIPPSNPRDWQSQVAETPYVEIDGDRVVIHNFRNFDYFSKTDFRPRWETKTVQLSNLRTADFFTNFWGPKLICHTLVSFDFGPDGYVCISIETRTVKGQQMGSRLNKQHLILFGSAKWGDGSSSSRTANSGYGKRANLDLQANAPIGIARRNRRIP